MPHHIAATIPRDAAGRCVPWMPKGAQIDREGQPVFGADIGGGQHPRADG
jgi:hypothetical protein